MLMVLFGPGPVLAGMRSLLKHPLARVGFWVRSKAGDTELLNNFMLCMIVNS
jgi:hypothetical protein